MSVTRKFTAAILAASTVAALALLAASPADAGCGGCSYGPPAPPVEAVFPLAPPVVVGIRHYRHHYCGCDYGVRYVVPRRYVFDRPYIVEQGPVYSGPGITTVPTYIPPRHYYQVRPVHHHHHHHRAVLRTRG